MPQILITQVTDTFIVQNQTNSVFEMKDRSIHAIIIAESGSYTYVCGGEDYLSDPGHLLLVSEHSSYRWKCHEHDRTRVIHFKGKMEPTMRSIPVKDNNELLQYYEKIAATDSAYGRISLAYALLSSVFDTKPMVPEVLQPQVVYIHDHFHEMDMTNEQLAAMSNISTVYFRKRFTAFYKCSPQNYIKGLRLQRAKQLLKLNRYTVSEIAQLCGYESIYTFSAMFKKSVGLSPSAYAKQFRMI